MYGCPWSNQGYPDPTDYSDLLENEYSPPKKDNYNETEIQNESLDTIKEKDTAKSYSSTPSIDLLQASVSFANGIFILCILFLGPALAITKIIKNNDILMTIIFYILCWICPFLLFYIAFYSITIFEKYKIKKQNH